MTDAEIELAARELCRLRGVDPDAPSAEPFYRVESFNPWRMVECNGEHWQVAAQEVRCFAQVGTAIASVLVKPKRARKEKK
jgi:hypothetical protein